MKPSPFHLTRLLFLLMFCCKSMPTSAGEWKSELFRCAANIPDSTGWQIVESPAAPGITVLLAMQQPAKQAVFGINIVEKYRDANLADPAIQKELETMLRQFGYAFFGHSNVKAGAFEWLQYPVRSGAGAQQVTGVIRFTSAGGYVFSITMLRGGGQEAAQDAELQQAASSFRLLPAVSVATTAPPAPKEFSSPKTEKDKAAERSESSAEAPAADPGESNLRYVWYAIGAILTLLLFFSIIGTGAKKR